ncbi:lactadherin-like [Actinia tenebrosa]|uniref:Lactadherin-like n=1 Tax=Actinia tenebrosa TaxID=6105 RepID=A0A6P8IYJ7_ACTTE|nr:lactadherin-like [Actinia tenebrosa]
MAATESESRTPLQTSRKRRHIGKRNSQTFLSSGCTINLNPIGVSNSNIIPDDRFTATSYLVTSAKPHYARLNGMYSAWIPNTNVDPNDCLQIDLGEVFVIRAVATQGHPKWPFCTKEYKISTSIDSNTWTMYQSSGKVKLFHGNTDENAVKTNVLDSPVDARFIRFIPTKYKVWKALRVEVYGRKKLGQ